MENKQKLVELGFVVIKELQEKKKQLEEKCDKLNAIAEPDENEYYEEIEELDAEISELEDKITAIEDMISAM